MLGQQQSERNFADFRRLKSRRTEMKPALGSLNRHSDQENDTKKREDAAVNGIRQIQELFVSNRIKEKKRSNTDAAPQNLSQREKSSASGHTASGAVYRNDPYKKQKQCRNEANPIQQPQSIEKTLFLVIHLRRTLLLDLAPPFDANYRDIGHKGHRTVSPVKIHFNF